MEITESSEINFNQNQNSKTEGNVLEARRTRGGFPGCGHFSTGKNRVRQSRWLQDLICRRHGSFKVISGLKEQRKIQWV
ncbi:unnamed protein product [Brassica rapa]|uniref:Uncharacterized protein n=1 Tax=Brassica campestris TaxID=3711 RepID=A0A8D9HL69_BRACM|nr:unnamed protein product [Brassica rapa]